MNIVCVPQDFLESNARPKMLLVVVPNSASMVLNASRKLKKILEKSLTNFAGVTPEMMELLQVDSVNM